MKNLLLLSLIGLFFSSNVSYSQSVTFNVTTVTDNGTFTPKHVLAIWVEDSNGAFVKSIKVNAAARIQYLYSWNAKSGGNKVDAVTGATLTAHQSHTVTWNCKNTSGIVVPPGTYKMMIEFTDKHAQGPINSLTFSISGESQHVTQVDQTYFKNISIDFTPPTTGIVENTSGNQVLSVFPNPSNGLLYVTYTSEKKVAGVLRVININGSVAYQEKIDPRKLFNYPIQLSALSKGSYILEIRTDNEVISQKFILY